MLKICPVIFSFLFLFHLIHANPTDSTIQSATEGDPSSTLCESVNLLTGDFVAFSQDLTINAVEPLYIRRHYVSSQGLGENGGWEFFPHLKLYLIPSKIKKKLSLEGKRKIAKDFRRIVVAEPNGTRLFFKRHHIGDPKEGEGVLYSIDFEKHGKGITNTSRGIISGRTNLKNYRLSWVNQDFIKLVCADGTERFYYKTDESQTEFLLHKEILPNGNRIKYNYVYNHQDYRLTYMCSTNPDETKTYAWIRVQYEDKSSKSHDFTIETSDERNLSYKFQARGKNKKEDTRFFLQTVNGPELPPETIEYTHRHDSTDHLVQSRSLPGGRTISTEYYLPEAAYLIAHQFIETKKFELDERIDKVKTLLQPLGENGALIPSHQLIYRNHNESDTAKRYQFTGDRFTDVYDVDQNKTTVHYNYRYLTRDIRYHEKQQLHHSIKMQWTGITGELSERAICDQNDTKLLRKKYTYDLKGNVLIEELMGTICSLDSRDTYPLSYSYDDADLLTEKKEPSGLITRIQYLPKTNLILQKHITDGSQLHIREFYTYNKDHILIGKITDDGSSEDPKDLTDLTQRRIERIRLNTNAPLQNIPKIIEEKALDLATGQEILVSKIRFHYNNQAKVIQKDIFDAANKHQYSLYFTYDQKGRLKNEANAAKQVTKYLYDVHGNIRCKKEPSKKITRYVYDSANRLISEEETAPNVEKRYTQYKYDCKNNKIATIDPFGNETRFEYDAFGNLTKILHPDHTKESFTYDVLGHQTSHTNPSGVVTQKVHNILGKPLKILYPDQTEETFTYTLEGKLHSHTNQEGLTLTYTYDALGREIHISYSNAHGTQIAEETFLYDSFHLLSHTDKEGIQTSYTYDIAGRKKSCQRGQKRIEYEYDALGHLSEEKQLNGENTLVTRYTYNLLDQLTQETQEDLAGHILHVISYNYDILGNRTKVVQKDSIESFIYDCFNRLTLHTTAENHTTLIAYDENHLNAQGQRTLRKITLDPLKYRTIDTYDTLLRPIRKEIQSPENITLFAEDYILDPCGNCILQQSHVYEGNHYLRTLDTAREFDSQNRTLCILEGANAPEEKVTRFTYTKTGQIATTQKPDGVLLTYSYNILGHLSRLSSSDGTIDYTYDYTLNGQLRTSHDNTHHTSTKRILDDDGNLLQEKLANNLSISAQYDPIGRRTHLHLPQTTPIQYRYNPLFLTEVSALGFTAHYTYNEKGLIQTLKCIDTTTYHYDKMHRITHLYNPHFKQIVNYDPRGNIIDMLKADTLHTFAYDGLNQLITENNHAYSYDSCYNRMSKDDAPYTTNTIHALLQAGSTTFTYDLNGNPHSKLTSNSRTKYKYDALDRLIEVIQENTKLVFTYDSFHRRMTKTVYHTDGNRWVKYSHLNFLYDGQDEIGAYDPQGNCLELRILGRQDKAEREALFLVLHNQIFRPIQDLQGNVVSAISLDNRQVLSYRYTAFGEEDPQTDLNPWRYASKRLDPETGLVYFGRRYYDPDTGRFFTPDPAGYTGCANLYAYTLNNPLTFLDLYGLFPEIIPIPDRFFFDPSPQKISEPPPIRFFDFEDSVEDAYKKNQEWMQQGLPEGVDNSKNSSFLPFERSSIYDLQKPEINTNQQIMLINGILNRSDDAKFTAEYISGLAGGCNVHGVHSASYGLYFDYKSVRLALNYIATDPVKLLHQAWDTYFKKAAPNATIMIIAHSRGTAELRNALLCYDAELRKRILVLAIAPIVYISPEICRAVQHYRSTGDPLPFSFDEQGSRRYKHTIETLNPHVDANKYFDHGIRSPTYNKYLKHHLTTYINTGRLK